ncbi:AAA family ATPase [Hydrogenimonas sp.]
MRISRLLKIRNHRIFRNFVWPSDLPTFAQFNVIYGWNGSGKTAFSSLFENLQDGRPISIGEVEFELDNGNRISGNDISTANVPSVRVFNRDFVARTIEAIGESNVAPIYFLGAESIDKQKQVETLKEELEAANGALTKAKSDKQKADKALDDFCIEKAKLIKEALLGSAEHANYDKRRFRQAIIQLKDMSPQPRPLSDKQKKSLRKQKELKAKPSISKVSVPIPDVGRLRSQISTLLKRSIVSKVIDELAGDPQVGAWVQQGLSLHKGERETDTCRFCGNEFSPQRRSELEAHFNDAFASFQREIAQVISGIESQQQSMKAVEFPDASRFYDHLADDIQSAVEAAKKEITSVIQTLGRFRDALERKKANPFEILTLEEVEPGGDSDGTSLRDAIEAVNSIIEKHETVTKNLKKEIKGACQALEQDYVREALPKFDELANSITEVETAIATVQRKPEELQEKISTIEREIVEHRRPAEELNHELRAYLGRDELKFDVKDTGYALMRGGQPALHLSEGERTAIAFLYFLKSLEDKAFDLSKGIVVIDDPVSSLDANALFSAFGYMKERTKECNQLFILTHNFAFFRQVKNWFHHLKGQNRTDIARRPARFYSLQTTLVDGERSATLSRIDPLLEQFESEYHFLFRQVYDVANNASTATELAQFYAMPNIARRMIEIFLAYRFPDCGGNLFKRFERVDFDLAKKTRILRLLNTYSHSDGISDPEHDLSLLAETREVMNAILELIQKVDYGHYQGMMRLLQTDEMGE